jgi:L-ascorbate 6-phosphate lactonase
LRTEQPPLYLGYVIETAGFRLYHSGDSLAYDGLAEELGPEPFDVLFLPINGRDAKRLAANCIGNMTYQEAADLAGTLSPRLTVPAHYDMFAGNRGDPAASAKTLLPETAMPLIASVSLAL